MRILDRYLLKNCAVPFLYCVFGFIAIWLVFDLSDNGPDFIEARVSPIKVMYFYATQLPQVLVLSLPIGLLLALLYSLSRMSRSNEIISMLGAGIGVVRLLLPLMGIGLAATAVSIFLNYRLAPKSEAMKQQVFELITKGEERREDLEAHLFRDRRDNRTWFISKMTLEPVSLKGIHIMQQDAEGNVLRKWYARRANYSPEDKGWLFRDGKTVDFDAEGNVAHEEYWDQKLVTDWPETPQRLASASYEPQNLSVDELADYLRYNSDFPESQLAPYRTQKLYRWALPWSCFIVVFIAAPLGIVFSRRGVLAGVASSIFIFFGMVFFTNLFLALGKGARISPVIAAWGPNIIFGMLGVFLLYLRSSNRELPKLWPRRAGRREKPLPAALPTGNR